MSFSPDQIQKILMAEIAQETKQNITDHDVNTEFVNLGLDSLSCIYVIYQVEKKLDRELNPSIFWDYPTIRTLSEHLHQTQGNG
jgi:acyl carrier protein